MTHFSDLLIRAGQDQISAIIRNELCENLALTASDHVIASRSRYCVVYIDGNYTGIYALTEKLNEQHYADLLGVSRNSVTDCKSEVPENSDFYRDVIAFCSNNDMADEENYQHIQTLLDLDSLIDWTFLEGYFACLVHGDEFTVHSQWRTSRGTTQLERFVGCRISVINAFGHKTGGPL